MAEFSIALSRLKFKEDLNRTHDQLEQMIAWNKNANFAFSSLADELKITYQERPARYGKTEES